MSDDQTAPRLGGFIERVYEAAVVPELWRDVLADFSRLAGAAESVLIATRGTTFNRWIVTSPAFEEVVLAHSQQFPTNERTKRLVAAQHAGFLTDSDILTPDEINAEPVYQEFLLPRGYGRGVATVILAPSGDSFIIHSEYLGNQGPVSPEVIARLDQVRPHLARAVLLSARLELERVRGAAYALEIMGLPAAILKGNGLLLAANNLFAELVPDVVRDRTSGLVFADRAADQLFATAIESLRGDPHQVAVRSIPIRASETRPPMIVHLVPITGAARDVFTDAAVVVVVTPVVPKDVPSANVIQALFDLTPAEARLATLIGASQSPSDAALQLGISVETVRSTLKRIFAKTGARRQVELVALLNGTTLPRR